MATVFASDQFPKDLSERARLRRWQEFVEEHYGGFSMSFAADRRFFAGVEMIRCGPAFVHRFQASMVRLERTTRGIARDGNGDFMISLNCGHRPVRQRQQGPEVELTPQSVLLHTNAEPGVLTADGHAHCLSVFVERNHLLDRVRDAEDLIGRHIDVDPLILRYLRRYLEHLIAGKDEAVHPLVADQIGTTLLDLVALTLANGRDGPLSHSRGIRGARLQEVLVSITSNFDNAGFSPSQLAAKLGLTQRYIQDLLYETGRTFSERVMELRLQKARVMLGDPRHDKLKISDIAYACGFNEVSYFNRCFRRRFGASPSHYRDRGQG